jgi:hypothetical protein
MARSFAETRQLSKEAPISEYDQLAKVTVSSVGFIRDEILRRDLEEQSGRMEQMTRDMAQLTKQIRWMTVVITVLTLISTVAVVWSVIRPA